MSEDMLEFKKLLAIVADGTPLTQEQTRTAFDIIMSGNATPAQMGGFLMALRVRGETIDEITGAVRVMREKALKMDVPEGAVDLAGTGGDASGTFNISTAASFVAAGAGVPVAKHGNRAMSSKSGSADVLTALGVNIDCDMELVKRSIDEAGICFMMAPRHHGAMRHVAPVRVELGTRTIFNLLGVMSNPAEVKRQLIGVFARKWQEPMAGALKNLGAEHVWIIHGEDGLDEMTTTGTTYVTELKHGDIKSFEITPEEFGIKRATMDDLKGGDPDYNAAAIRDILGGARNPFRDITLYTAGGAILVGGKAATLQEGITLAEDAIDSGKARAALDKLISITNEEIA